MKQTFERDEVVKMLVTLDLALEQEGWDNEKLPCLFKFKRYSSRMLEADLINWKVQQKPDRYVHWLGHRLADRADEHALAMCRILANNGCYAMGFLCEAFEGEREVRLIHLVDVQGRAFVILHERGEQDPVWADETTVINDYVLDGLRRMLIGASRFLPEDEFDLDAMIALKVTETDCTEYTIGDQERS